MGLSFADLARWSASGLAAAGDTVKATATGYQRVSDDLGAIPVPWQDDSSVSAFAARTELSRRVGAQIESLGALKLALYRAANDLADVERHVATARSLAVTHEFSISDMGVVSDVRAPQTFPSDEELAAYQRQRVARRDEILAEVEAAFRLGSQIDRALASALVAAGDSADRGDGRDPDGRDGLRVRRDEWRLTGRDDLGELSNDWAGRAILDRYLSGGDDWTLDNDPTWSAYMMSNPALRFGAPDDGNYVEGMQPRTDRIAGEALRRYLSGGPATSAFADQFHQAIQNGEGIVGYQYLHGTDANTGDFRHWGTTTVAAQADGTYAITINASYEWNDTIDPNPRYGSDINKNRIAEALTLGVADPYQIHIRWDQPTTIVVDSSGRILSRTGWPG